MAEDNCNHRIALRLVHLGVRVVADIGSPAAGRHIVLEPGIRVGHAGRRSSRVALRGRIPGSEGAYTQLASDWMAVSWAGTAVDRVVWLRLVPK